MGRARIKRFVELLQDEKERKLANFQEAQEVEQWLQLLRKMRAAQLPQTKDEIRSMAISVFVDYSVDEHVELALDNRSKYLERLGGRDGARSGEDLYLHCPHRAKESGRHIKIKMYCCVHCSISCGKSWELKKCCAATWKKRKVQRFL